MARRVSFVTIACSVVFLGSHVVRSSDTIDENAPTRFRITHVGDGHNFLTLPLNVDDQHGRAMLNTYSPIHLFDVSLQAQLGSRVARSQFSDEKGNPTMVAMYRSPPALIGRIPLSRNVQVGKTDLAEVRRLSGLNILAIVGTPFFRERIVHMNFDDGWLSLSARTAGIPFLGTSLDLVAAENGLLRLNDVEVSGKKVSAALSTGLSSAELMLESPLFDQLVADGSLRMELNKTVFRDLRDHQVRFGVLRKLLVGPFEMRRVQVVEGYTNSLGLPWLTRFEVALDVTGRVIHLKPGKGFDRVDLPDLSGLHLAWKDETVIVEQVDENSPAWQSRILPGDEVTRFQGKRVGDFHISEIRQALRKRNGNRISMTVRRDGQEIAVHFALKYGYWDNSFPLKDALPDLNK